jgi:hypothetical protein
VFVGVARSGVGCSCHIDYCMVCRREGDRAAKPAAI